MPYLERGGSFQHRPSQETRPTPPLDETLARLERAVAEIQDSETFRRYLDAQSRFHKYSWANVMLVLAQKPESSRVAGYVTWQQLGRQVRKGERGIRIVVPMRRRKQTEDPEEDEQTRVYFGQGHVWDISQTDGEPLPQVEVPVLAGEQGRELYGHLEALARAEGLAVEQDAGAMSESTMGYYQPAARRIVVRAAAPAQMAKTLCHELAHHFSEAKSSSPENETIAEACAYVVCAHFGLDTGERSFPYVATWSQDPKTLKAAMGVIQSVSAQIIDRIEAAGVAYPFSS